MARLWLDLVGRLTRRLPRRLVAPRGALGTDRLTAPPYPLSVWGSCEGILMKEEVLVGQARSNALRLIRLSALNRSLAIAQLSGR